jgi:type II secretory pathway pseudopilin PulG
LVGGGNEGFTLVEAVVALTLSAVVVVLVSTVFLVQNRYYEIQVARSAAHDGARTMTEGMASELRSVAKGGVKVAESSRLVVRSPIVLAVVCAQTGSDEVAVQFDGGPSGIDTGEVTGFAVGDTITDDWSYYDGGSWSNIVQPSGTPASACAANGADTTGASGDFTELRQLASYHGSLPAVGQLLMLYREVEYTIEVSDMRPVALALFRSVGGGTPVESATGLDPSARFQYRTGGSSYANAVAGSGLWAIDAIRIVAEAREAPRTGGVDDVVYGWAVNVILRNGG